MRRKGDLIFFAVLACVAVLVFWVLWGHILARAIFGGGS